MKQLLLVGLLITGLSVSLSAQTNPTAEEEKNMKTLAPVGDSIRWTTGGTAGFNATFTYLNQWAAGGNNSISTTGLLSYYANYRKGKHAWDNSLDIAYGLLLQGFDSRAIKTDDKFDFSTASSYLTDKLAKDTRVIVKQDGDEYTIQLRNLQYQT
jgi:hypothetical protein